MSYLPPFMNNILCIIQCSKSKEKQKCTAEKMYSNSSLFKQCISIAKDISADTLIISTKHGFIKPDQIINPYEFGIENGPIKGIMLPEERKKNEIQKIEKEQHLLKKLSEPEQAEIINNIKNYKKIICMTNQHFFFPILNKILSDIKLDCWFNGSRSIYNLPTHLETKKQEFISWSKNNKYCAVCSSEFHTKTGRAKVCSINCNTKYYKIKYPEKRKASDMKYLNKNREKIYKSNDKWLKKNKERHRKTTDEWVKNNREKKANNVKKWLKNNPWYYNIRLKRNKERYKNDPVFKIKADCRNRLNYILKLKGIEKFEKTFDLIGCTPHFLFEYLKENYKKENGLSEQVFLELKKNIRLDIDHIIPLNTFDLMNLNEQKRAFHYTNLRFLNYEIHKHRPKDGSDISPK
jgi:hypothetical protein